jgi:hypothetical protein
MKKAASKPSLTADQIQQVEQLLRVGCAALQQGKPLEESQQIGATALDLIAAIQSLSTSQA